MLNNNNIIIIAKNILYCNMDQKIISVIGGSGFIGNYLIDKLLELGYYVKIISRKPIAKKNYYQSAKLGQYSLITCNICDEKKLGKVIALKPHLLSEKLFKLATDQNIISCLKKLIGKKLMSLAWKLLVRILIQLVNR